MRYSVISRPSVGKLQKCVLSNTNILRKSIMVYAGGLPPPPPRASNGEGGGDGQGEEAHVLPGED